MAVKSIPDHPNDPEKVTYSNGTHVAEISTLQWDGAPEIIHYKNQVFRINDWDMIDGETVGWNYRSTTTTDQFLLIND